MTGFNGVVGNVVKDSEKYMFKDNDASSLRL